MSLSYDYDSAGLNYGDLESEVKGILIAQNVTYYTLEECRSKGCNLLITHHPSLFGEEIDAYGQSLIDVAKNIVSIFTVAIPISIVATED